MMHYLGFLTICDDHLGRLGHEGRDTPTKIRPIETALSVLPDPLRESSHMTMLDLSHLSSSPRCYRRFRQRMVHTRRSLVAHRCICSDMCPSNVYRFPISIYASATSPSRLIPLSNNLALADRDHVVEAEGARPRRSVQNGIARVSSAISPPSRYASWSRYRTCAIVKVQMNLGSPSACGRQRIKAFRVPRITQTGRHTIISILSIPPDSPSIRPFPPLIDLINPFERPYILPYSRQYLRV